MDTVLGGAKWSCSFWTIGLQSVQQILEEPVTDSSGHQFGSCGGSLCVPRCGAHHSPQTGRKHAGCRHPQSSLPLPKMFRTFRGMGEEHQVIENALVAQAPRSPSTHLILLSSFTDQTQPHQEPLELLQKSALDRRRQGVRPTTRKNYITCIKSFLQFMFVHELDPHQPSLNDVGAFMEFLLTDHTGPATIQNYLTAVRAMYKWWARSDILQMLDSYGTHQMMKGIANIVRPPPKDKLTRTLVPYSQDM